MADFGLKYNDLTKKKSIYMFTNLAKNCNKLSTSVLFTSFWDLASTYRKVLQLWSPGWWSVEIFLFLWICFFYLNLINLIKRSQYPMGWNVRPVFVKYCALNWPNTSQIHVGSNAVILKYCWAQLTSIFEKQVYMSCHSAYCDCISMAVGPIWSAGKTSPACLQKVFCIYVHVYLITYMNSLGDMEIVVQSTWRI